MSQFVFLLFALACPLMMIFMMRGMHGGHGHGHTHTREPSTSLDDLRRQRDELEQRIERLEADEQEPVAGSLP